MRKFGIAAARWIEAAVEIGPCGLCGATWMWCASAIAAIFFSAVIPPAWQISGCTMSVSFCSMTSRNSHGEKSRSPVAISVFLG